MPSALGKILVIRGGAIGDFILTVPVLSALRRQFPEVRLELLAYPRLAELALAAGLVDQAAAIDARPMASFFARRGPLPTALCEYFASFAVIISYLFDPDRIFQENVARCSKAQFIVGPHRPDERGNLHATDTFLQPLVRLAIFDADPVPQLKFASQHVPDPELRLAHAETAHEGETPTPVESSGWLALHPGSGSERKNWPEENWAELLQRLAAQSRRRFLLVGGEAEGERLEHLAALISADRVRLAKSLPLSHVGLLLQQCSAFLGHDSGISHLAAAVGLRGLLLWGESREELWRPRSPQITVMKGAEGLATLSLDDVWNEVQRLPAFM